MAATRPRAARDIWWVFLVILVADTVLVSLNTARSARNEGEVGHTLQVLNTLNLLHNSILDAEAGARGFVITGIDDDLKPYDRSIPEIPKLQQQLRALTEDNSSQQERLKQLAPHLARRLELLDQLIAARRRPIRNQDDEIALVTKGGQAMDEIRSQLNAMRDDEQRLLEERRQIASETQTTSIYTAIIGGTLTIGMLVLANYLIRREDKVRRRSEASLQQSEERFRLIAESLPQLVWVTQPDGHHEFCNQPWYRYTGHLQDQSLGCGWATPVHDDEREHFKNLWKRALATGEPFVTESRFQRFDGAYRWFLVRVVPLQDQTGAIACWLGTATDIDDQKRMNEELEGRVRKRTAELQQVVSDLYAEANERERATSELHLMTLELARSNKELEQFAYLASHDLQEPLRKIQSFGDRLKTKFAEQLSEQGREYIERMQSSATRMRRLIDDLLAYSRVVTRPQPFTDVDLNIVAQEVLGDLEDAIERTGAQVDVGPLPTIRADALQMRQLMQNLLSNAIKFHKSDEPPIIAIQATNVELPIKSALEPMERPAVRIDVIDNGIGFDNSYQERIFEIFQRLHGRGEYEGTGIGLAMVRKIAERHGGTASAHGEAGEGATFTVILPISGPYDSLDEKESLAATHASSE